MKDIELTPVEELSYGSLEVGSVGFDWTEGYGETWESYEVPTCGSCGTDERVNYVEGEWRCYHPDRDHGWGAEVESESGGPMMNYYYPLDEYVIRTNGSTIHAAMKIKGLPLCIVDFTDADAYGLPDYALALTGGGMDLSWEICEAFMRLGELPPTHFAELPGMAGRPRGDVDEWIVRGCLASLDAAASRAASRIEYAGARMRGWLETEVKA